MLLVAANTLGQGSKMLTYKENSALSDKNGVPKDSFTFYFPIENFYDSIHSVYFTNPKTKLWMGRDIDGGCDTREELSTILHIPQSEFADSFEKTVDTFSVRWYSEDLYAMKEPLLYNFYTNKEIYRLTWLRSFDRPVTITIEKNTDGIYVTSKMLEHEADFSNYERGKEISRDKNILLVVNSRKAIAKTQYSRLISLIDSVHLTTIPSRLYSPCNAGTDGSEWILEVHNKDGYYFINRWSPKKGTALRTIGELMIHLSEIQNEEIY